MSDPQPTPPEHTLETDNRIGRENTAVPQHTLEPPPPTEPAPFGANPKPPLKIINIDGDIDFSQPVPDELETMLRDNSKEGPVTIWSSHLVEPNYGAMLWNWLLTVDSARFPLSMQLWEPPTEVPPDGMTVFTPPAPPPPTGGATGATGATGA
jgi:hypothetical protein